MNAIVNHRPALVLNADFRPLSYFPLSLWPWQEAIKAVFLERVNIVSHYNEHIHSPSTDIRLPSVISLKNYVHPAKDPAFTRFNVFLRDGFQCQYCGSRDELTFDHIIPRSQGGVTSWENIIAACAPCNLSKGGRTPKQAGMHLRQPAYKPTTYQLQEVGRHFPPRHVHDTWRDFLCFAGETTTQEAARRAATLKFTHKGSKKKKIATEAPFPDGMSNGHYWSAELET